MRFKLQSGLCSPQGNRQRSRSRRKPRRHSADSATTVVHHEPKRDTREHTKAKLGALAKFQLAMFWLKADVEENICE